jgi:hypothetical protein
MWKFRRRNSRLAERPQPVHKNEPRQNPASSESVSSHKRRKAISVARVRFGIGIEDPKHLTRRCIRGIEEPSAVAEEDQVACDCHARVGRSSQYRYCPGSGSRSWVYRSADAVIHARWSLVHIIRVAVNGLLDHCRRFAAKARRRLKCSSGTARLIRGSRPIRRRA